MTTDNTTITPILFGFERECKRSPEMVCCRFACQDANECQWNSQPTGTRQEDVTSPFGPPSLAAHEGDKSAASDLENQLRHAITDEVIEAYKSGYYRVMNNFSAHLDPAKEATRLGLARAMKAFTEEMLVIEQQERNLHDIVGMANDLLASLDPDDLNPEQFNAYCALADRVGHSMGDCLDSDGTPLQIATEDELQEFEAQITGRGISEETQAALDDIDANIRSAAIRAKDIWLD